jgi:hypothetical protein
MTIRRLAGLLALSAALLPGAASAQDTEGAFQLGLGTSLFSYSSATLENDDTGAEIDSSVTMWGVRQSVSAELGYGLSDMIVLGGMVVLGGASQTIELTGGDEAEVSEFAVFVGPKIDFMFSQGAELRPFVGAAVGIESALQESEGLETTITGVELVGRVGLRWFASEGFSLDPAFAIGWGAGGGELEDADGTGQVDVSASGFSVGIVIAASGWM